MKNINICCIKYTYDLNLICLDHKNILSYNHVLVTKIIDFAAGKLGNSLGKLLPLLKIYLNHNNKICS